MGHTKMEARSAAGDRREDRQQMPGLERGERKEYRRGEQSGRLEVASGQPELRGMIRIISGEYAHTAVREGMQQINDPHEEQRRAKKQEVVVPQEATRVVGDYEDGERDGHREHLGQGVEQDVIDRRCHPEARGDGNTGYCEDKRSGRSPDRLRLRRKGRHHTSCGVTGSGEYHRPHDR